MPQIVRFCNRICFTNYKGIGYCLITGITVLALLNINVLNNEAAKETERQPDSKYQTASSKYQVASEISRQSYTTYSSLLTDKNESKQQATVEPRASLDICTHRERIDYIKRMCQAQMCNATTKGHRFVVDDQRKVLFCEVSKSGCTTWKTLWEKANNGSASFRERIDQHILNVHTGFGHKYGGIRLTGNLEPNEIQNYIKFAVVRHPLERFLSAYLNIKYYRRGDPGPDRDIKQLIAKIFSLSYNGSVPDLTVSHLAEFVTNQKMSGKYYADRHFKPFSESCAVCELSYDYIIRLETTSYDAGPVLKLFNYSENYFREHSKLHSKEHSGTVTGDGIGVKYINEFQNVKPELLNALMERYQHDLRLFGYHFEKETLRASCNIKVDNNRDCC